MTEKELKKLHRSDLLELLIAQEKENEQLRSLLELKQRNSDKKYIASEVSSRNFNNWYCILTLDKGTSTWRISDCSVAGRRKSAAAWRRKAAGPPIRGWQRLRRPAAGWRRTRKGSARSCFPPRRKRRTDTGRKPISGWRNIAPPTRSCGRSWETGTERTLKHDAR